MKKKDRKEKEGNEENQGRLREELKSKVRQNKKNPPPPLPQLNSKGSQERPRKRRRGWHLATSNLR